uniref:Leucine-rich repeat-containing N-terminal plant-type domain-containing protein n=1 Tax=Ananas comosus var. bracteatus TaxID=296719 RepID=A0A6V7P2R4_ANACO|nr:unnamed protein product [Ananas comosus var. bracteatus]
MRGEGDQLVGAVRIGEVVKEAVNCFCGTPMWRSQLKQLIASESESVAQPPLLSMQPAAQLITVYHFPTTLMASRLLRLLLLLATLLNFSFGRDFNVTRSRKAIEIGIGIGIGIGTGSGCSNGDITRECFQNDRLYNAYLVIQRFKSTITCDPQGITDTWSGTDICGKNSYVGILLHHAAGIGKHADGRLRRLQRIPAGRPHRLRIRRPVDRPRALPRQLQQLLGHGAQPQRPAVHLRARLEQQQAHRQFPRRRPLPQQRHLPRHPLQRLRRPSPRAGLQAQHVTGPLPEQQQLHGAAPRGTGLHPGAVPHPRQQQVHRPIPSSIVHAANTLLEVLFLNNQLSGCLPFEIGLLKKATVFDAGTNLLTGPIPLSFGCLKKIEQLNLADNKLYGEVPDVLCRLGIPGAGNLMNLSLSDNYFTSLGHSCWILLKKGVLDVRKNCIPGVLDQRSPEECKWFLWQKKYCPLNTYIPCQSPWPEGADQLNSKGRRRGGGGNAGGGRGPRSEPGVGVHYLLRAAPESKAMNGRILKKHFGCVYF